MSKTALPRVSGILLHPTSFPSPYGIGDMGYEAYEFIDFLHKAGQHLWQILPLTPTGYGDSPYQSFSAFAGQPLIISPALLKDMGLVEEYDLLSIRGYGRIQVRKKLGTTRKDNLVIEIGRIDRNK